ncbi:MAG: hypothetical protein ACFB51_21105 [Anaerolineae bacterium]
MTTDDRAHRAAELLLTDPSLTDNLDDSEANILLDWGVMVAKRVAAYTESMDEQDAYAHIDEQMTVVRQIMRRINSLMAEVLDASLEEITEKLKRVYSACEPSQDVVARESTPTTLRLKAKELMTLSKGDALRSVLSNLVVIGEQHDAYSQDEGLNLTGGPTDIEE